MDHAVTIDLTLTEAVAMDPVTINVQTGDIIPYFNLDTVPAMLEYFNKDSWKDEFCQDGEDVIVINVCSMIEDVDLGECGDKPRVAFNGDSHYLAREHMCFGARLGYFLIDSSRETLVFSDSTSRLIAEGESDIFLAYNYHVPRQNYGKSSIYMAAYYDEFGITMSTQLAFMLLPYIVIDEYDLGTTWSYQMFEHGPVQMRVP